MSAKWLSICVAVGLADGVRLNILSTSLMRAAWVTNDNGSLNLWYTLLWPSSRSSVFLVKDSKG